MACVCGRCRCDLEHENGFGAWVAVIAGTFCCEGKLEMAKRGKKVSGRAVARRGGGLTELSTTELRAELTRRSRAVGALQRKRARLAEQLAVLDAELAGMGGAITDSTGRRRRARNDTNLADKLAEVLKGKTMSVTEAAGAVQQAGYVTTAANFRVIVNQTLIRDKRFKKVSRGQYTA
jgi:hypothetical protein